jgi:serine/threonine protein kinase/Tol biopolymer transport system component
MRLSPNARLGRYEIRQPLGAGGMGEVYLAHDTKLGRTVALKILPADVASDQNRMQRFIQEAKAASALNHPNIITIHEIEETDSTHFIATEFIDGETLKQRMARARLTIAETLDVAIQVASALSSAHEAGIIHRDIKPENIMLRRDGIVKVLDFGLAKLTEVQASSVDSEALTKAIVNTEPGTVMGTAHYMSPEQARGLETDARTDIWSLGVVLYEMVAGRQPFVGETTTDVLASIIKNQPAPLTRSASDAPAKLEEITAKALEKDREERYQGIKDLLVDLRRLKKRMEFAAEMERSVSPDSYSAQTLIIDSAQLATESKTQLAAPAGTGQAAAARPTSSAEYIVEGVKRHKTGFLVALSLIVFAGVAFAVYRFALQAKPAPSHFQNIKLTRITTEGNLISVAVSPDGKYIAYSLLENGKFSLWTKHLATDSRIQIVQPLEASGIVPTFFSHDGGYVFYTERDEQNSQGALFQVPVLGGTPKKVLMNVSSTVALSPDGKQVAFGRSRSDTPTHQYELWVANADGTGERRLCARSEPEWFSATGIAWSPDGRFITIGYGNQEGGEHMTVATVAVADGALQVFTKQRWLSVGRVAWFGDGSGMAVAAQDFGSSESQIWQISYPGGETRRITNDLNSYNLSSLTMTDDSHSLVVLPTETTANLWVTPDGDYKNAHAITSHKNVQDGVNGIQWMPDGKLLFVSSTGGTARIWTTNADGSGLKPLFDIANEDDLIQISPDGRYIFFLSLRSKTWQVWRVDADGSHPKQLTEESGVTSFSVTPDGRSVIYDPFTSNIMKVPVDAGPPTKVLDVTGEFGSQVSPDGKLLAYIIQQAETKRMQLVVTAFDSGAPLKTFDLPLTTQVPFFWSADSRALIYIDMRGGVSNLWRQALDGSAPKQITDFKSDLIYQFAYSPDGRALALARGNTTLDAVIISEEK